MQTITINISQKQLELAEKVAVSLQKSIGNKEPWTSMRAYLEPASRRNYITQVESSLQTSLQGKKILEVGSGMGMFVVVSRKLGLNVQGIEPCANSYNDLNDAINELLSQNNIPNDAILREAGEKLPWPDQTFDIVVAFQVLEHVADPAQTLRECLRVLKPGGKLFMDMPNYFSFVEAHYGIVWWPWLSFSKKLARVYVKMNAKNPVFLHELNFVTPWRIRKWLNEYKLKASIIAPPNEISDTVSVKEITFTQQLPGGFKFRSGQRFSKFGTWVRKTINKPSVKKILYRLDMMDHIILTAEKN
jgi:2-polyprenyl-3-methyl-5-hydroxy-6-metoxy-1,4-benzoquinol methylase